MIKDSYNRIHNYLRISLTDNCNLRCFYCMPEEEYEFAPASKLMQKDEIETLAKIFCRPWCKQDPADRRRTLGKERCGRDHQSIIEVAGEININDEWLETARVCRRT